MKLSEMAQAFVDGKPKRGLYMKVTVDKFGVDLRYTSGDKLIANIKGVKPDGSYVLTVYTTDNYHFKTGHKNRITEVLKEVERKEGDKGRWFSHRYHASLMYGTMYVWDMKTRSYFNMAKPMAFNVGADKTMLLDYQQFEQAHNSEAEVTIASALPLTSNLTAKEEINELLTLVENI